jgi:hypothetical protein
LFYRFSSQYQVAPDTPNLPAPAIGGNNLDFSTQGYNTVLGWNHVFTPNLIGTARLGWNYTSFDRNNPAAALGHNWNRELGIPGGTLEADGMFSLMSITGYRPIGIGGSNPVSRGSENRQASGDMTWIHGRHTIKSGVSFLRSHNPVANVNTSMGNWTFNGAYSGDGAADFLTGTASQWVWQAPLNVGMRTYNLGAYVQDDYRVSNRLSLSFGVRYELSPPWYERNMKMGILDLDTNPSQPTYVFATDQGSRYDRALVATDKDNVMGRFGLSFKLNNKTVIRSGYGQFFAYMENFGDGQFLIGNPPFAYGVTLSGSNTTPALNLSAGPAAGATDLSRATGLRFNSYQRTPKAANAHQWNLNIQRELGADWLVEVGYSGSRGIHLVRQYDGNFSPAGPGNIDQKRPFRSAGIPGTNIVVSPLGPVVSHRFDGNSIYHAMMAKVEKRFSKGFTLLSTYTWSKAIGDTCGNSAIGNNAGCGYQNVFDLRQDRSLDNQDVPHRFVSSGLYDIPVGRGRAFLSKSNRLVDSVLGGWSIGSIVTISSALPFSVTVQGNPANTGTTNVVQRANAVGDPRAGERTLARDFNVDAFARPANFTYGTSGRNILRGRSQFNWDFSALKNFQLVERVRLQFRFEGFAITNTPRFGAPGNVFGTAAFGTINSAETPRNLQFALKLIW